MLARSPRRVLLGLVALAVLLIGIAVIAITPQKSEAPSFVNQPLPTAKPTEPPSPTPEPTPRPNIPIPQAFRDFVRNEVEPALARQDLDFFVREAHTQHIVCTDRLTFQPQMGGPRCNFVGEEFEAIIIGRWRSEGARVPLRTGLQLITDFYSNALKDVSDGYGDSQPRILTLGAQDIYESVNGIPRLTDQDTYTVVLSALVERPPQRSGAGPLRVALLLDWRLDEGEYRLESLIEVEVLTEEVLDPPGPEWWWALEPY